MTLALHTIKPAKGSRTKAFRIGRGNASGRGTTAGRGTKGQRARTGGRKGLKLKGMKQMLLQFPKLRGFRSRFQKPATVTLTSLSRAFPSGATVDLQALQAKRLVSPRATRAKLVGAGAVTSVFALSGISASISAKTAIEKAGGSVALAVIGKGPAKGGKNMKKRFS